MEKKNFRLFDAVLMAVVVVMVVESIAPAAAIGPSQFFWWLLLLLFFFIPYGLISSELGTAYPSEGGLFTWVKKAFGSDWGTRVAWIYWISFPFWLSSLAILFVQSMEKVFSIQTNPVFNLVIQLAFIWTVVVVGNRPISESKWIINSAAIAKIIIVMALGGLGVYAAIKSGTVTQLKQVSLVPSFKLSSLGNLSVIIFNFLGFEVVAGMSDQMDNPKKQIPRAIMVGGALIAFFYLFAAFGIGSAIPSSKLSASSGLLDSITLLVGHTNLFTQFIGVLFMFALLFEMVSWSMGVNRVAVTAYQAKAFPKIFGRQNKRGDYVGAGYVNGLIATVVNIGLLVLNDQHSFNTVFTLNIIAILLAYMMLFPTFMKLRTSDPNHARPFKIRGGRLMVWLMTVVPEILIVTTLILTLVPAGLSGSAIDVKRPIWFGTGLIVLIGELITRNKPNPIVIPSVKIKTIPKRVYIKSTI